VTPPHASADYNLAPIYKLLTRSNDAASDCSIARRRWPRN